MPPEDKEKEAIDLQNRVKDFNGELIPILKKYKIGIAAVPFIAPDGRVFAHVSFFNDDKPKVGSEPPGKKTEGGLVKA